MYLAKTYWWLKALYPTFIWNKSREEKVIYLSFDDGPNPTVTPFVLDLLKQYKAKATFFCIGKNVVHFPALYHQIINEGHSVGNHTQHHLNGWQTKTEKYIHNIQTAALQIQSNLFRPPYGRIKRAQANKLTKNSSNPFQIIMWDVLSGDFDTNISGEQCFINVTNNTENGSIIVFHDSDKAWERLSYTLPKILELYSKQGFEFKAL
ncbi:MAG TPA: polysaccharide deacetylase family protein [Chitinophagaceae bacterium]|nr:polysaccharide deacetylase family protein [Chitinophagaceae bacterium]HMZ47030.1 polysaccharide deacetylase family protein [Chitinophagaceae bacterium]HNE93589.1 polysaccharide deacetylase family protein [Chitinophagaceae bacterium]HNF29915.1 polysaccharide deacetylase family protein [Chitinophagaceae bacterium]HNJ57790.1 polysaccharide deacetylase family protein [Chitinophagaceae bacterium]